MIMRKMKKFLCALLASTMVLAMAAPSFAVETLPSGSGSITINSNNGDAVSRTYTVYQLFSLESYNGNNYAYKVTDEWNTYIRDYKVEKNGVQVNAFNLNADGYLLTNELGNSNSDLAIAFAKDALAHAPKDSGYEVSSTNGVANLENIALGYYLIDSTVGTLCMLDTNDPEATVTDKNVAPTLSKSFNDAANEDSTSSDVKVGDTASYRIVISAGDGAQNYVLTDTMSDALDYVSGSAKVYKVTGMTVDDAKKEVFTNPDNREIAAASYNLTETSGKHGFTIEFNNALTADWTSNDKIVVIYDATVNATAATGTSITNTAKLAYGDGNETPETPPASSTTYQFDLEKIAAGTKEQLSGAKFNLYDVSTEGEPIELVDITSELGVESGKKVYRVATAGDTTKTTAIEAGYAVIKGLDCDVTYYLQEIVAPTGYNLLSTREAVKVSRNVETEITGDAEKRIENSTGTLLPSTGGIGTTIFYAVGIILMAGAVFFVVRRKKA